MSNLLKKQSVTRGIAIVLGISLVSVGLTVIVAPRFASAMFGVGVADEPALVYVYATGLRDIAIGCLLFVFGALRTGPRVVGVALMIFAAIPIGDAIIVWTNAVDLNAFALALHISSAIVLLALGFWLQSGRPGGVDSSSKT